MRGFDETLGEQAGTGGFGHGLCTECDGSVFVVGNVTALHWREEETKVFGGLDLSDLANVALAGLDGGQEGESGEGERCDELGHF